MARQPAERHGAKDEDGADEDLECENVRPTSRRWADGRTAVEPVDGQQTPGTGRTVGQPDQAEKSVKTQSRPERRDVQGKANEENRS